MLGRRPLRPARLCERLSVPQVRFARLMVVTGFGAFGIAWGAWGAVVPGVREATGASQAQLGAALLLVAAGAVPTMVLAPKVLARFPRSTLPVAMTLLGLAFAFVGTTGTVTLLAVALTAVGATSGLADVSLNTIGARLESLSAQPLLQLGHGCFSAAVVIAALTTGLARDAGAGPLAVLGGVAVTLAALSTLLAVLRPPGAVSLDTEVEGAGPETTTARRTYLRLVGVLGAAAAVAFLIENGFQSWSAEHLEQTLGARAAIGGTAAALFAVGAASGRFAAYRFGAALTGARLMAGAALVGALGAVATAVAPRPWVALAGIALSGAGISIIFPLLISQTNRRAEPGDRDRAVARVGVIAYVGFLVSPPLMGLVAGLSSLRGSFALLAALAVVLAVAAPQVLATGQGRPDPTR